MKTVVELLGIAAVIALQVAVIYVTQRAWRKAEQELDPLPLVAGEVFPQGFTNEMPAIRFNWVTEAQDDQVGR